MKNFNQQQFINEYNLKFIRPMIMGKHPGVVSARFAVLELLERNTYNSIRELIIDILDLQTTYHCELLTNQLSLLEKFSNETAIKEFDRIITRLTNYI